MACPFDVINKLHPVFVPMIEERSSNYDTGAEEGDRKCKFCVLSNCYFFILQYVQTNKEQDNDWFRLESNKEGTRWFGKCWYIHELLKYEFDVEFDVSKVHGFSVFAFKCFNP